MPDRIDHAAEAQRFLAKSTSVWGSPSEVLAGAQVHATLAIVEQLRSATSSRWEDTATVKPALTRRGPMPAQPSSSGTRTKTPKWAAGRKSGRRSLPPWGSNHDDPR